MEYSGAPLPVLAIVSPGGRVELVVVAPFRGAGCPDRRLSDVLAGAGPEPVVCDVGRAGVANLITVEALSRLQLAARRAGCSIVLRRASPELVALLQLTGLMCALPTEASPLE